MYTGNCKPNWQSKGNARERDSMITPLWLAGSKFPHQGSNRSLLQWKQGVWTTGPLRIPMPKIFSHLSLCPLDYCTIPLWGHSTYLYYVQIRKTPELKKKKRKSLVHGSAGYSESSQMCLWANSSQLCVSFLSHREEQKLSSKHHMTFKKPNGNPLQCSCLENPRDGGAWWAAVSGVAQGQTWLKWLSSSSTAD